MDRPNQRSNNNKGAAEMQRDGVNEARPNHMRINKTRGRQNVPNPARNKTQNRVSQKSFREKQTAYVQYLESFVETVKASHGSNVDSNDDKLLRAHLIFSTVAVNCMMHFFANGKWEFTQYRSTDSNNGVKFRKICAN
jgi:hypothetical protein